MTTTNLTDRLFVADDQRVDKADFQRVIDDPMEAVRRAVRLVAERSPLDASGVQSYGCVLRKKGVAVTFGSPTASDVSFGPGLELVFATTENDESPALPYGDCMLITDGTEVAAGAKSGGPVTFNYILARPAAPANTDNADRVRWNDTLGDVDPDTGLPVGDFEVFDTPTSTTRALQFTWRALTDAAGLAADMANGYHLVCMVNNSAVIGWFPIFPKITNTTDYPEEDLTSATQALLAATRELAIVKGAAWDAALPHTDANLANNYNRVNGLLTTTQDASTGNAALGVRATALETLTGGGTTGNAALGVRVASLETLKCKMACSMIFAAPGGADPVIGGSHNVTAPVQRFSQGVYVITETVDYVTFPFFTSSWKFMATSASWIVRVDVYGPGQVVVTTSKLDGTWGLADPDEDDELQVMEF